MTIDTTSTGMPPITPAHDALDVPPMQGAKPVQAVQSLVGEGKAQVSTSLNGVADAVRDIATKLEGNGAGPVAKYMHDAADAVAGWAYSVDNTSVEALIDDAKNLVRTSPALAVGLAVVAGFAVSRVARSGR